MSKYSTRPNVKKVSTTVDVFMIGIFAQMTSISINARLNNARALFVLMTFSICIKFHARFAQDMVNA